EKLAAARGEKTRVAEVNGFTVVEDDDKERAVSRIAMRPGGPIIVGAGKWLDTMMEVARTGKGTVRTDDAHDALRTGVEEGNPAIVVTAVLPKTLREKVRKELADEALQGEAASAMDGVLGVSRVAAAFNPGASGSKASLVVLFRCESDDQCAAVERLIERKQK